MISTAYYPYPVNDKSAARRAALQPHIYSPSESHHSPRNAMYPLHHASGSPSPTYIYSGYEQYYSKDSWVTAAPSSWSAYYPFPPRSSSLPQTAINPKVTILPPQPILVSDIDTPSSISSHSVLTPSSPFAQHDVDGMEFQSTEFDEFDCDDDEDFIDSDFADEMEGIDEADQGPSPLYGASAPHVIKSTSALEGALGDTLLSSSYGSNSGAFTPADRRLTASVPGYPSTSHRSSAAAHQRWSEKMHSPTPATSSNDPHASYPSQQPYTQRHYASSISLFAPTPPSLYNHTSSSSSLAGAFASSVPSPHASRPTSSHPLPILQPQPIRPIPPIPLTDLTSSANESCSPESPHASPRLRRLSPLPLLCQPVSDVVRYQLKEPADGVLDGDACYDHENASESMCQDLVTPPQNDRFAPQGLAYCSEHPSTGGACAVEERLYSYGCMDLPIRWQ
ncbi:hypothetical protein JVT61DRAFT_5217 [Boletus reticuloceps]|uniref:Uncharacterized protein n=1 Tax=Boletus reticuloceps TaxID=495285 RepID=A0A8I2YYG4_9AGAM|nr:hypothetical protein JVT61DRAFT_5217 [Boletus reticuloceps]